MTLNEILDKYYVMALVGSEIVGFTSGDDDLTVIWFTVDKELHEQYFVNQEIHLLDHPTGGFLVNDIDGKDCGFIALDGVDLSPQHDDHPEHTREVWRHEVFEGNTQQSYSDWVNAQIEEEEDFG